jgi:hypothetical protein
MPYEWLTFVPYAASIHPPPVLDSTVGVNSAPDDVSLLFSFDEQIYSAR